jgi:hypothetical protein
MKKKTREKLQRPQDGVAKQGRRVDDLAQTWLTPDELRDSDSMVIVSGTYGQEGVAIRVGNDRLKMIAVKLRKFLIIVISAGTGWAWGTHQIPPETAPTRMECQPPKTGDEAG